MNKTPWFRTFSYTLSSNKVTHIVKYQSRIGAFLKNTNKKTTKQWCWRETHHTPESFKPKNILFEKKKKWKGKIGKKAFEGVQTVSAAVMAVH